MTLTQAPEAKASVNSELIWQVYDANAIDPLLNDYKYVFELHIDGNLVQTERIFPRPDTGHGLIDFAPVIRSYINPTYDLAGSNLVASVYSGGAWKVPVVIKVREEYNGTVGGVVFTDTARTFYNHYNDFGAVETAYSMTAETFSKRPKSVKVPKKWKRYYVPFVWDNGSLDFDITTKNQANNEEVKTINPAENNVLHNINIARDAVVNDPVAPNTIGVDDEFYSVKIHNDEFLISQNCGHLYKPYVVHFLGQSGGWESMTFDRASNASKSIERKSYQQLPYRSTESGYTYKSTNGLFHEQATVFHVARQEKIRLRTDWLTDQEHLWLATLLQSPFVILDDNTNLIPVRITETDYQVRQWITDRLQQLTIEVQFTSQYNSQTR